MKLFAVVSLLAFAFVCECAPSNCQWGPSYWCKSAEVAKACGKKEYCEENVWRVTEKKDDGINLLCDACSYVAGAIDNYIRENATEDSVRVRLNELCAVLGNKEIVDFCQFVVEKYFDQIWDKLENFMEPDDVCVDLDLCSSAVVSKPQDMCSDCKLAIGILDGYLNNATESELEDILLNDVCPQLGEFASECEDLVKADFPMLWDIVVSFLGDPSKFCSLIGFCNSSSSVSIKQTAILALMEKKGIGIQDEKCDVCHEVFTEIDDVLSDQAVENTVEEGLKMVCNYLAGFSIECKAFIDTEFKNLWNLLLKELAANTICVEIGLCPSSKPFPKKLKDNTTCAECRELSGLIEGVLKNNDTKSEAKSELEALCNELGPVAEECTGLVDEYFDQVWTILISEFGPDGLCVQLGVCPGTKLIVKARGDIDCEVCDAIKDVVEAVMHSQEIEDKVKDVAMSFCKYLGELSGECQSLVTDLFDDVWKYIENDVVADICDKECPSVPKKKMPAVALQEAAPQDKEEKAGPFCVICELVLKELEKILGQNKTEGRIIKALDDVCNILPSTVRKECTDFINEYGPELIQALLNVPASEVCTVIGVCSSEVTKEQLQQQKKSETSSLPCLVCEYIIEELVKIVGENSTEAEIEEALDHVCSLLPSALSQICDDLVNEYGPEIVQLILQEVDPQQICDVLKLCDSNKIPAADTACASCVEVIKTVKFLIQTKAGEDVIEDALADLCKAFPDTIKDECGSFVKKYAAQLVQLIALDTSPEKICTTLGLCQSGPSPTNIRVSPLAQPWVMLKKIN